MNLNRSGPM